MCAFYDRHILGAVGICRQPERRIPGARHARAWQVHDRRMMSSCLNGVRVAYKWYMAFSRTVGCLAWIVNTYQFCVPNLAQDGEIPGETSGDCLV
jgi:hypothetical protein